MAYLLYKHIKAKRAAAAEAAAPDTTSGRASDGGEKPQKQAKQTKQGKPIKLCDHQREVTIDSYSGMPTEMSDFSTTPKPVENEPKDPSSAIGPCVVCKAEKRAARIYRWKLIAGLFFPFTVQALDTTIVAGALPFIASDFRKFAYLAASVKNSALC